MSQAIQQRLERATPESQGIASQSILNFIAAVEAQVEEFHSFMLLRHGRVVAEGWWSPYSAERIHSLYSLSKSFTSTAVGLAIEEVRFGLDDLLIDLFPDDLPATISENLAKMRVRHLLSMGTGHAGDTMGYMFGREDGNWAKGFLSAPVEYEPSSHFAYNTGATYMLSALVHQGTGMNLLDYLEPRLFQPLGIVGATWEACPRGISVGGFGLSIKTEDIAAFGQLYLQKGVWNGKRILSEAWVDAATRWQISNGESSAASDWTQGYGYQFWRCRHEAYRGDGAFGQYCIVFPEMDAVLAITAGLPDMQIPLNLVWEYLLTGMQPQALPEDEADQQALREKLANLSLAPVAGEQNAIISAEITGKTYQFSANELGLEQLSLNFDGADYQFSLKTAQGSEIITVGYGAWQAGQTRLFSESPDLFFPIVASGAWISTNAFKMQIRFIETPFFQTLLLSFMENGLLLAARVNVGFEPPKTLQFRADLV